jgi:hypothetical protein
VHEGDISHAEVNEALKEAEKTIVFGRQTRVRDGLLLEGEEKLPRFHIGHDQVKFFYSAVRQLPEYFLDALLARNISVTLVAGRGLCCFKDVRNHQAIHIGRTRRTIYLPEKILDVAFRNGYDYWSIAQILVRDGSQLLDFILLYELVILAKRLMLKRHVSVPGYNAVRRMVRHRNKHRSTYESPDRIKKKENSGIDVPISELDEFLYEYEKRLLDTIRADGDGRLGVKLQQRFRDSEPDAIVKALYNTYQEELWGEAKVVQIAEEQNYPSSSVLDRDIVHPAAYEMAEAYGMETAPQNMNEACHDYRDALRFDLLPESPTDALCHWAARFGPQGIEGLIEEFVADIFVSGYYKALLVERARAVLGQMTSRRKNLYLFIERGAEFMRCKAVVQLCVDVRTKRRKLELEDLDWVRIVLIGLVSAKASAGDMRRMDVINAIETVGELFAQVETVLAGEAGRLLDRHVERVEINELLENLERDESAWDVASEGIAGEIMGELEKAVVRAALCLDVSPEYQGMVNALVSRGARAERIIEEFLVEDAELSEEGLNPLAAEQQGVIVAAQKALLAARTARGEDVSSLPGQELIDADLIAVLVPRVGEILEALPEKPHACTSGSLTPLRKAMKEFEEIKRRYPTDLEQLGPLAMALVRMDCAENYEELLGYVRWMGKYAIGQRRTQGSQVWYTPGLLKTIDDEGPGSGPIVERAATLIEELADEEAAKALELIK